ncbi:MAG: pilin [Patescibacteria group bacterium]|nr:pilin [Patescibacteria group bacterium]
MKKNKALNFIKFALVSLIAFSFLGLMPAQSAIGDPIVFEPQIGIPGFNATTTMTARSTTYIGQLIKAFYDYGLAIGGILAAVVLMAGGLIWLASGGSSDKITQAKGLIIGSISGIGLLFGAWIILNTVNPDLINFRIKTLTNIEPINIGCCQYTSKAAMTTDKECQVNGGKFMQKTYDRLNGDRYYNIGSAGTKCSLPGCCVSIANNGTVLSCAATMSDNCPTANFYNTGCAYASGNFGSCPTTDVCQEEDTEDGDDCFEKSGLGVCYCYDKIAWYNKGGEGEPCGNEDRKAKCTSEGYINLGGIHCNGDHNFHDQGGRSCGTGLYCCYDERN